MDVGARVKHIIAQQLALKPSQVSLDAPFTGALLIDDLDRQEIIMSLEDEFGCEIADEDFAAMKTGKDVVAFLEQHLAD